MVMLPSACAVHISCAAAAAAYCPAVAVEASPTSILASAVMPDIATACVYGAALPVQVVDSVAVVSIAGTA